VLLVRASSLLLSSQRALITADHDVVPSDPWGYRVAIAESFLNHAVFPVNFETFGEETLLWLQPKSDQVNKLFQTARQEFKRIENQLIHLDHTRLPDPVRGARVRAQPRCAFCAR
jgi:hypothetical protein